MLAGGTMLMMGVTVNPALAYELVTTSDMKGPNLTDGGSDEEYASGYSIAINPGLWKTGWMMKLDGRKYTTGDYDSWDPDMVLARGYRAIERSSFELSAGYQWQATQRLQTRISVGYQAAEMMVTTDFELLNPDIDGTVPDGVADFACDTNSGMITTCTKSHDDKHTQKNITVAASAAFRLDKHWSVRAGVWGAPLNVKDSDTPDYYGYQPGNYEGQDEGQDYRQFFDLQVQLSVRYDYANLGFEVGVQGSPRTYDLVYDGANLSTPIGDPYMEDGLDDLSNKDQAWRSTVSESKLRPFAKLEFRF